MTDIIIDTKKIQEIDLSKEISMSIMNSQFDEGPQPYKFYAYMSYLFNNSLILDIGTEWGNSALALSQNDNNRVISYEIIDHDAGEISKSNIDFKIMDFMKDEIDWSNVSIILVDVDPHDSIQERKMIKFLESVNWKGILLLDDVGNFFPHMNIWFNTLKYEKYILEINIGHYSGTGLVNFGGIHNIVFNDN
jgi:hypothetical protein